jgi:hypothetical protein
MTNDFLEDASDILDESGEPYLIIVGRGGSSYVYSNMGPEHRQMLQDWLATDHVNDILRDQLQIISSP